MPIRRRQRLLHAPATLANGTAAVVAALRGFALARWIFPSQTPEVGEMLRNFGGYAGDHLPLLGTWATGTYLMVMFLALLAAWILPNQRPGDDPDISSWQHVIRHARNSEPSQGEPHLVRIALGDGGVVDGSLHWYSTDTAEVADSDLVQTYPPVTSMRRR